MLILAGKVLGLTEQHRDWTNPETGQKREWDEQTIHLLDGMDSRRITVGRDFPAFELPKEGDDVALSVFARGAGNKAVYFTALGVVKDFVQPGLPGTEGARVKPHAVNG